MIGPLLTAWIGHTDRSRADAHAIRATLGALGWKYADVAAQLGIDEKRFCRQLAGIEPLNHWRLADLPEDFHREYDRQRAAVRGALVLEPDMLTLIRGALAIGRKRMASVLPQLAEHQQRRRA